MTDDTEDAPVRLTEDADTGDRFLVYGEGDALRLDIRYEGETLWMTQAQIGDLFGRNVSTVSRHIANILAEGELEEATSLQKLQTSGGRPATIYSLDMVISVGYRVSSARATLFRRWATGVLVRFARSGFVVDAPRLKAPDNADRIAELRALIRDIRADEANLYRELRLICSMCQDYTESSQATLAFYRTMQAKLVHAVTSHTPSEIVHGRADAASETMGLTAWPNANIRKADVTVSKNYLSEGEVRELNRLTTILLDIFEDQLEQGRLVVMEDAMRLLDAQLRGLGRAVLDGGGSVSAADARARAEGEYAAFDARRKRLRREEADARIAALAREAKALPKPPRKPRGN